MAHEWALTRLHFTGHAAAALMHGVCSTQQSPLLGQGLSIKVHECTMCCACCLDCASCVGLLTVSLQGHSISRAAARKPAAAKTNLARFEDVTDKHNNPTPPADRQFVPHKPLPRAVFSTSATSTSGAAQLLSGNPAAKIGTNCTQTCT